MDRSLFITGKKPRFARPTDLTVSRVKQAAEIVGGLSRAPEPTALIEVDSVTECHVTPHVIALRMASYFDAVEPNATLLEPSAGTGNLIAAGIHVGFSPDQCVAVERHCGLANSVDKRFHGRVSVVNDCFLEYSAISQKRFSHCLINPPFKKTKAHITAALGLMRESFQIVALVPVTFDHPAMSVLEELDNTVFSTAKVYTKIIMIES